MWRKPEPGEVLVGNRRFAGFAVDLIQKVSELLEFEYELYPVPDGNFGSKLESGEWNGMIGQVLNGVSVLW